MPKTFDSIIIGAGQAGPTLAGRLTQSGRSVAFIERKLFGGTCVNTGCTPTKALVASAYVAQKARTSADYGVTVPGTVAVDMKAVKARKDQIVLKSRNGLETYLRGMKNCTVFTGQAHFESPNQVRVGDDLLTAKEIFINVGGRAVIPDFPGADSVPWMNNVGILELETLPRHLIVVGGSYVGLEFGQIFRRFGSEVTIIEKSSRLVSREDEDVSASIKAFLEKEGITVRLKAECIHLHSHGEDVAVGVNCEDDSSDSIGSHVLLAVGRIPNTDDLGLDRAGVKHDKHGFITVDDQLRTSVPGIWALGDCNGRGAFTHTSYNDYEIVADNLLNGDHRRVSDRIQTYALYIDPPLGRCGMTDTDIRKSGHRALVAKYPMGRVSRAVEKGETQGFIKIAVDAETKQILGAAILGTGGDEVIHVLLDVMYAKAPYTVVQRAMHIHPTVAEYLPTVLSKLEPFS